jgi:signal transduction histidine kinase
LSRDIEGSGLGLSIVKHVVQAHGGKVVLRSVLGQGSSFVLSTPSAPPGKNSLLSTPGET